MSGVRGYTQDSSGGTVYLLTDLGTLGGTYTYANSINSLGRVTGSAETASGAQHAFFWNGKMRDLGVPTKFAMNEGDGINGHNHVAGWAAGNSQDAFLDAHGTFTDLGIGIGRLEETRPILVFLWR
jgi:probable HAF family extracellular repeat protein